MLREVGKVKTVVGNTQFQLQAEANESFRIRDIHVYSPASEYVQLFVNKTLVGYYRVGGGTLGNHLHYPIADETKMTLMRWLMEYGMFNQIPVPSGMLFSIVGAHDSDSAVTVVYDEYDSGDVRSTEINGTDSNRYQYINYGRYSTTLAAGYNLFETQQTSNQFPAFPFGRVVPSKHTMTLHGLLFSDLGKATSSATNRQHTNYVKMVKDRKTLFDDDMNGFPALADSPVSDSVVIGAGRGVIGNYDSLDLRRPLIFDPPLVFQEGDDLDIYVSTTLTSGSVNIAAKDAEIGLIFDVTRKA